MTVSAVKHRMKYSGDTVPWLIFEVTTKGEVTEVLNAQHNLYRPVRMAGTGAVTTAQTAFEAHEKGVPLSGELFGQAFLTGSILGFPGGRGKIRMRDVENKIGEIYKKATSEKTGVFREKLGEQKAATSETAKAPEAKAVEEPASAEGVKAKVKLGGASVTSFVEANNLPKNTIVGGEKTIGDLVDYVLTDTTNAKRAVRFQTVTPEEAAQLKKQTNLDLEGYHHTIDNYGIKQALEQHGNMNSETQRGQLPIEKSDIQMIPEIVKNYDSVKMIPKGSEGSNGPSLDLIRYEKRIDGSVYYVEEVRTGRNELTTKSLWKTRAAKDSEPGGSTPFSTPETTGGNPHKDDNILSRDSKDVKQEGAASGSREGESAAQGKAPSSRPGRMGKVVPREITREEIEEFLKQKPLDTEKAIYIWRDNTEWKNFSDGVKQFLDKYGLYTEDNPLVAKFGHRVVFAPDPRALSQRGLSDRQAWIEYAAHALSGTRTPEEKNIRYFNSSKAKNLGGIEVILRDADNFKEQGNKLFYYKKISEKSRGNGVIVLEVIKKGDNYRIGEDCLRFITYLPKASDNYIEKLIMSRTSTSPAVDVTSQDKPTGTEFPIKEGSLSKGPTEVKDFDVLALLGGSAGGAYRKAMGHMAYA